MPFHQPAKFSSSMTLTVLFILVIIASALAMLEWQRTSRALYFCTLAVFLAIGCGPVPSLLLKNLQLAYANAHPPNWGKRNVIVLLGAGTQKIRHIGRVEMGIFAYGRLVKAAALYRACRKESADCKIILSGGDARHNGISEAEVYKSNLSQLGVNVADLLLETRSMNTWQNAQFTSVLLRQIDSDSVLLVSSGIHLRRSLLYFSHFDIRATPARADYLTAAISLLPTAYNFAMADAAIHEYAGIGRYYIYKALGWNAVATRPGSL